MKTKSYFLFIVQLFCVLSCVDVDEKVSEIGTFDISRNGDRILFSYYEDNNCELFTANIEGDSIKTFMRPSPDENFFRPRYSPDGSKVVFVKGKKEDFLTSSICIANADGSHLLTLATMNGIITEAFFSRFNKDKIIFCAALQYKGYSPLSSPAAHDFDLYSLHIKSKSINKISAIKAYEISSVSELDSEKLIFHITESEKIRGIYTMKLSKTTEFIRFVTPPSYPRSEELFNHPTYSAKLNLIAFTQPSELYVMDLKNANAKRILNHSRIIEMKIDDLHKKIIFRQENETSSMTSIDIETGNVQTISIDMAAFIARKKH